jgi:septal ring factor EnvC (AmiA/AmiB activator)
MFFVIIGISLIFVVTWILKSENRINACKDEMKKLKTDLDSSERERFVLSEKIANLKASGDSSGPAIESLKEENRKLKKELSEAKSSLEEVYKALAKE